MSIMRVSKSPSSYGSSRVTWHTLSIIASDQFSVGPWDLSKLEHSSQSEKRRFSLVDEIRRQFFLKFF